MSIVIKPQRKKLKQNLQLLKTMNLKNYLFLILTSILSFNSMANRLTIDLDGTWQVEQGLMNKIPAEFNHKIKVPGILDLAEPKFNKVGVTNSLREAFWYRRTFKVKSKIPAVALLKINKAKYGTKVFLNGNLVGEHLPCFTPGFFDVKPYLHGNNAANELAVRVGATEQSVPESVVRGMDVEKQIYLPGIYDSVSLMLTDSPYIKKIQIKPVISEKKIEVWTDIQNTKELPTKNVKLRFEIAEKRSGKIVAKLSGNPETVKGKSTRIFHNVVKIPNAKLWSPDNPFLYILKVYVETDKITDDFSETFGMRKFKFNPKNNRGELNGKVTYLNGSNFCIFRFFEDPLHGYKLWDEKWVRKLHRQLKKMHWNSVRYCIGFPPDFWYDIADEEGILIQNEFPIWMNKLPEKLTVDCLTNEFTEWIENHVNHPSVIIWDACNETPPETAGIIAEAIEKVRVLDKSDRPWENSLAGQAREVDCFESHPYRFNKYHRKKFKLSDLTTMDTWPGGYWCAPENKGCNVIINEYAWLWLNRDGSSCRLTIAQYENLVGKNAPVEEKREFYGLATAALTEFWRSYRRVAGVQHFCGLGYSRPGGFTCDNWTDLDSLEFEPGFFKYVSDAFSPVGLMLELWPDEKGVKAGSKIAFNVPVINDTQEDWSGEVKVSILNSKDNEVFKTRSKEYKVPALGREYRRFAMTYPTNSGNYRIEAELNFKDDEVKSVRKFRTQ